MIKVRAILLSPYGAELASLKLQRFRFSLAFTACCGSLFLIYARSAGVPKNLPQVLANCIGDLIVRDTAHVASTGKMVKPKTVPLGTGMGWNGTFA